MWCGKIEDLKFRQNLEDFPETISRSTYPVAVRYNILLLITVRGPREIDMFICSLIRSKE